MSVSVIDRIVKKVKRIADGKDPKVRPGQAEKFSDAASIGDAIRQGDLYLIVHDDKAPAGYAKPKKASPQLVPGNTQGAKHCLDSLDGVELLLPANWNEESLQGPFLRISKQRTVQHPTHGPVVIPAGFAILCRYQREYDRELAKERRARD